jgi:hypothetical protein
MSILIREVNDGKGCKMELTQDSSTTFSVKQYKETGRCWSNVHSIPSLNSANKRFDNNLKFAKVANIQYITK